MTSNQHQPRTNPWAPRSGAGADGGARSGGGNSTRTHVVSNQRSNDHAVRKSTVATPATSTNWRKQVTAQSSPDEDEHPLEYQWTFWFYRRPAVKGGASAINYADHMKHIAEFQSVHFSISMGVFLLLIIHALMMNTTCLDDV